MRTEKEFLKLVENKLTAHKTKKQFPLRAACIIAAAMLFCTAIFLGTIAMRRTALPSDESQGLTTIAESGKTVEISPAVTTASPESAAPETEPAAETAIAIDTGAPGTMGIFLPDARTYRGVVYHPVHASVLPVTEADIAAEIDDPLGNRTDDRLYTLRGVSENYFLLVDAGGLRGLVNYNYRPTDLGTMIKELNFAEELVFGSVYTQGFTDGEYQSWRIDGLDADRLWALLFAMPESTPQRLTEQLDLEAIQREAEENGEKIALPYDPTGQYIVEKTFAPDVSVAISLPRLGFDNVSIMISREGWLWTNLLSSGAYFAVSPTLCDDILGYAREAGTWIDTTPVCDDTPGEPEIYFAPEETVTMETVVSPVMSPTPEVFYVTEEGS